jgi:hypothetical protein
VELDEFMVETDALRFFSINNKLVVAVNDARE